MLTPYEQLFIHTFHHNGDLITEQGTGKHNHLFQLAIDTGSTSTTFPKLIDTSLRIRKSVSTSPQ